MAKEPKDQKERSGAACAAAVELTLDRVAKAAERSRGEPERALSIAIRMARAKPEKCALIVKYAERFAERGPSKAANRRALDVEPKLYEVQHLLNAATLLNRRMRGLADSD